MYSSTFMNKTRELRSFLRANYIESGSMLIVMYILISLSYLYFGKIVNFYGALALVPILFATFMSLPFGIILLLINIPITIIFRALIFHISLISSFYSIFLGLFFELTLVILVGYIYNLNLEYSDILELNKQSSNRLTQLEGIIGVCRKCNKIKVEDNKWIPLDDYYSDFKAKSAKIEKYCPSCEASHNEMIEYFRTSGKLKGLEKIGVIDTDDLKDKK